MKFLWGVLFLFFISNSWAKKPTTDIWLKHYRLVNKDIKTVEALKTRDLSFRIRLFELYGEKIALLIERENKYRIEFIETNNRKNLNKIIRLEKKLLRKIEKLSAKIVKQTKDKDVLAKVAYYKSLNFYLVKKYRSFYREIKKAERLAQSQKLKYKIHTKLADYYYNEKKFKNATIYYKKLVRNKKNKWLSKHYYNMAWSYFKLEKRAAALKYLMRAYKIERSGKYFKLGEQLLDSILLFYAYSKKVSTGLSHIKKLKKDSFENLLKYLHYAYEYNNKNDCVQILDVLDTKVSNVDQLYVLMSKKILVLKTIKKRTLLQKKFQAFRKKLSLYKKKPKFESKSELLNATSAYTGYLQELVKSKNLLKKSTKRRYIRYIGYNFNTMQILDPKNALKYNFFEGETFFSIEEYKEAIQIYKRGITRLVKKKKDPFLAKSFDSLFKSIEEMNKKRDSDLLFAFSYYLKYFPRSKKSADIYSRLSRLYLKKNQLQKSVKTLARYNKYYPKRIKEQKLIYREILNQYIDRKDVKSLVKLRSLIAGNFLAFTNRERASLDKVINQLYFKEYDELAGKGDLEQALAGFDKIANDKRSPYKLKISAYRKKMLYASKANNTTALLAGIASSMALASSKDKKSINEEVGFYALNLCLKDDWESCVKVSEQVKRNPKVKNYKQIMLMSRKIRLATNAKYLESSLKKNTKDSSYLFTILLDKSPDLSSKHFESFYLKAEFKKQIDEIVKQKFWFTYFQSLSLNKAMKSIRPISLESLKGKYRKLISLYSEQEKEVKMILPSMPVEKNVSFEIFKSFNEGLVNSFIAETKRVERLLPKTNINLVPALIVKLITNLEIYVGKLSSYKPQSKEKELNEAISKEMINMTNVLKKKADEYKQLYRESMSKTLVGSGALKYRNNFMEESIKYKVGAPKLWRR